MSNTIYASGADPGVTTGWAAIGVPADSMSGKGPSQIRDWQQGQLDGPLSGHIVSIRAIAKRFFPAAITCEGSDPRESNRSEDFLSPVRVESMLIFAIATGYIPLVTGPFSQMPGLASSTATDYRLQNGACIGRAPRTPDRPPATPSRLSAEPRTSRSYAAMPGQRAREHNGPPRRIPERRAR